LNHKEKGGVIIVGLFNFKDKDAARVTRSSGKDVSRAWHQARTDSGVRTKKGDSGNFRSSPKWAPKSTKSGIPFTKR
jgi:hypothetical protein